MILSGLAVDLSIHEELLSRVWGVEAMLSVFLAPILCRVPTCSIMGTGFYLREPQAMGGLDLICLGCTSYGVAGHLFTCR